MAQTELRKSDAALDILDFFEKLPVWVQTKIVASGVFALAENFTKEEQNELIEFLRPRTEK